MVRAAIARPSAFRSVVVALAAVASSFAPESPAAADVVAPPSYSTIGLQARSNIVDGFNLPAGSSFNSGTPALNDSAVVAFRLIVDGSTGDAGLWYGSDGAGSVVYGAPTGPLLSDPSLNSAGKCAFEQADIGLSDGILVYDPVTGMTQQEVAPGGIYGIDSFSDPIINDSDAIGFRADQGAQNAFIFEDAADVQHVVAFEGSGGVGFLFTPKFDNQNRLAAKVRLGGTAGSQPDQIRRYNPDGSFEIIAEDADSDAGSPFSGFSNGVGMSPGGLVAFVAQRIGGAGDGVYLGYGEGNFVEIATVDHPDLTGIDFFAPDVNDNGYVAFRGFDAGGRALFIGGELGGSPPFLVRVIGEHDLVDTDLGQARIDQNDSSPVFGGSVALNELNDIAFAATLTPPGNNQIEWGTGMFVAYADPPAPTGAPEGAGLGPSLAPPAPNPFAARTRIDFSLERPGPVRLAVFDVSGRLVRTLLSGERAAGASGVDWDGRTAAGQVVAPGVYFVRLDTRDGAGSRSVVRVTR
jgi:hypothetical protein